MRSPKHETSTITSSVDPGDVLANMTFRGQTEIKRQARDNAVQVRMKSEIARPRVKIDK